MENPTKISCERLDSRFCPISFEFHDSIESTLIRIAHHRECHDIPHVVRMEIRGDKLLVKGGSHYSNWKDRPFIERELKIKATRPSEEGEPFTESVDIPDQILNYEDA